MNFSKQTSQFDTCLNDHGRMPEWKTAYLTTPVTASMISLSVVNLLVSPCTIFLNALVMIAVKTSARMESNYHILLASLALTDLMTGALAQPLIVAVQLYRLNGDLPDSYQRNNCLLEYIAEIAGVTFVIASMQHLALLSVERFVAITYPYQYPEIITKRRLISSAIFAWSSLLRRFDCWVICEQFFHFHISRLLNGSQYFYSGLLPDCRVSRSSSSDA